MLTFYPLLDIYICLDDVVTIEKYKSVIDESQDLWCMHIHFFISKPDSLYIFKKLSNHLEQKKNATYSLGLGIFENEFFEINLDYLNNSKLSRFTALEFITSKSLIIDPLYNKFIDNCNQNNIKLELYFKADKTNINDFDVIIDYCVSKSIKLCILDIDKKATTNKLSKHEYKKIFNNTSSVNWTKNVRISMAECPYHNTQNTNKSIIGGCAGGITTCIITNNGDVSPCYYLDNFKVGNIKNKSLTDIWKNSDLFDKLRDRKSIKGKCSECENLICCGGCRAESYFLTSDLFDSDYNCWLK